MTELPPEGAEVAAAPVAPKRQKPPLYFHAAIQITAPLRVVDSGAELELGDTRLPVGVTEQLRRNLQDSPPEPGRPYWLLLWFRTPEGYVQELELSKANPAREPETSTATPGKPKFSVGARLKAVNREEGFLVVEVEPNKQGVLTEPFEVQIWAALDLLDKLPKIGRTLMISGEYRPQSGRLVATRSKPVHIGNQRPQPPLKQS